tara:strand:+ start:2725 stop:3120 length:396 start_codon:yes stop_codon:yes gene_type:complete
MGLYNNLIQTKIFSSIAGEFIGEDAFGNKYYEEKLLLGKSQRAQKRWVIYKSGQVEASTIPPKWFAWLHYTSERPLCGEAHCWEKPHIPNKTGSNEAYHPKTSLLNETTHDDGPATVYESWKPTQETPHEK